MTVVGVSEERRQVGGSYFGGGETFVFRLKPTVATFTWLEEDDDDDGVPVSRLASPPAHTFCPALSQLAHLSMVIGMAVVTADREGGKELRQQSLQIQSGKATGRWTARAAPPAPTCQLHPAVDVGEVVGLVVGPEVVGETVGLVVRSEVVGETDGDTVGSEVGETDGCVVGSDAPRKEARFLSPVPMLSLSRCSPAPNQKRGKRRS